MQAASTTAHANNKSPSTAPAMAIGCYEKLGAAVAVFPSICCAASTTVHANNKSPSTAPAMAIGCHEKLGAAVAVFPSYCCVNSLTAARKAIAVVGMSDI
ncbi:hypothetical protein DdX_14052 [Ditylenchus destructor]|uniref:Uncharacterized protein n=1 Tax=Ditylenchus destructor TaxID=166010 RepID=A0AAD4R208_9BILA|nr:hypothetical protein DdX_14052 [Ditylenchus destructor]